MTSNVEQLDRMIDALNDPRDPEREGFADADLAELVELARGLKQLGHTRWPDESFPTRAASNLSARLAPASSVKESVRIIGDDAGELPQLPSLPTPGAEPRPMSLPSRRGWGRKSLEIAAAVAVLVLFAGLVSMLLRGNGSGTETPPTQAGQGSNIGAGPSVQIANTPLPTPASTGTSTPIPTVSPSPVSPQGVSNPTLAALQQAAGFNLFAPKTMPDGLTLQQPGPPMSLAGGITSVVMKYVDANGAEALTITEASPYQDSAQTMPADVWNSAMRVEIQSDGFGRVTAHLFQSDSDIQMWWQVGPTSIRLETGGAPGTTMLNKDQVMNVALSMMPVASADGQSSATASPETGITGNQAVTKARQVIANLGGNLETPASKVSLVPLSDEIALGIPQPNGIDPSRLVWVVEFKDGLTPQDCPANWVSVCNGGSLVVVVDAETGTVFGFHGADGNWQ